MFKKLQLNQLSTVEQEIYRYIVNNLEKIPYMRVREIADQAHVSATSVFRFVQKVGFSSFPEFRFYLKNYLAKTNSDQVEQLLGLEERLQLLTMDRFHPDIEYQLKKIANALSEATFILFMGVGSSGAIAQYAARKLANIGYFSISIDELTYPIHGLLRKEQKNALVFFSVSGETKELIEVITGLEDPNALKKYCLTQNKKSTLAKLCDYSLEYAIEEKRRDIFYDLTSQLLPMAMIETIIGYLEQKKLGDDG